MAASTTNGYLSLFEITATITGSTQYRVLDAAKNSNFDCVAQYASHFMVIDIDSIKRITQKDITVTDAYLKDTFPGKSVFPAEGKLFFSEVEAGKFKILDDYDAETATHFMVTKLATVAEQKSGDLCPVVDTAFLSVFRRDNKGTRAVLEPIEKLTMTASIPVQIPTFVLSFKESVKTAGTIYMIPTLALRTDRMPNADYYIEGQNRKQMNELFMKLRYCDATKGPNFPLSAVGEIVRRVGTRVHYYDKNGNNMFILKKPVFLGFMRAMTKFLRCAGIFENPIIGRSCDYYVESHDPEKLNKLMKNMFMTPDMEVRNVYINEVVGILGNHDLKLESRLSHYLRIASTDPDMLHITQFVTADEEVGKGGDFYVESSDYCKLFGFYQKHKDAIEFEQMENDLSEQNLSLKMCPTKWYICIPQSNFGYYHTGQLTQIYEMTKRFPYYVVTVDYDAAKQFIVKHSNASFALEAMKETVRKAGFTLVESEFSLSPSSPAIVVDSDCDYFSPADPAPVPSSPLKELPDWYYLCFKENGGKLTPTGVFANEVDREADWYVEYGEKKALEGVMEKGETDAQALLQVLGLKVKRVGGKNDQQIVQELYSVKEGRKRRTRRNELQDLEATYKAVRR